MANGWQNTVPLGQAGTGAAYILPQSNAADNFAANMRQLNQQRQIQQQRAIQEARELAKSYQDNMLTGSSGRLWANEIGKLEQDHIRQGMEYRAQGFDIYNPDPNDPRQMEAHSQYMQDRARLESLREYRKGLETQYNETQKALQKANLGEYNMRDIQKLHDFVTGTSIMELYEQNAQLPNVGRRFNPQQYLPKSPAVREDQTVSGNVRTQTTAIDEPRTAAAVIGSITNAPGGAEFMNELTGGIDPMTLVNLPGDRDAIRDQILRDYQGDPQLREALATSPTPVLPDTPALDQWIDQQADSLYQAKQRFQPQFDSWMSQVVGSTKTGVKETPDTSMARLRLQEINTAISQQRERRLASGESSDDVSDVDPMDLSIPYGAPDASGNRPRVNVRNYIPVSIPSKNFMGADGIDLYTGQPTKLDESSSRYSVVGLTEVPVGRSSSIGGDVLVQENYARENPDRVTYKPMIHVTLGDGEDYFIDINRMPQDITKAQRSILNRFNRSVRSRSQAPEKRQEDKSPEQIAEDLIRKYSQ